MSAKRKLDLDEQKTRVIAAVQQLALFSKDEIYREYYDMTNEEIARMKAEMEEQQQKEMEQQAEQAALAGPEAGGAPMAGPGPMEAGGQEGAENVPPTANEDIVSSLETLQNLVLEDDKKQVLSRIIEKQQQKA